MFFSRSLPLSFVPPPPSLSHTHTTHTHTWTHTLCSYEPTFSPLPSSPHISSLFFLVLFTLHSTPLSLLACPALTVQRSEAKDDAQLNSLFAKLGGRRGRQSSAAVCGENSDDGCATREPREERHHSLQLTKDAPQRFEVSAAQHTGRAELSVNGIVVIAMSLPPKHMTMWPTRLVQGQLGEDNEAVGLLAQLDAQACRAVEVRHATRTETEDS